MTQQTRDRERWDTRAAAGLCRRCGIEPVPDGMWACPACRERKRWALLKRFVANQCQRCQAPRDRATALHCAACRLKCRVHSRDYVQRTGWKARTRTVGDVRWKYLTGEAR